MLVSSITDIQFPLQSPHELISFRGQYMAFATDIIPAQEPSLLKDATRYAGQVATMVIGHIKVRFLILDLSNDRISDHTISMEGNERRPLKKKEAPSSRRPLNMDGSWCAISFTKDA